MSTFETNKPRIIFVIRYFHPFIGGLEKNTLNLAASLIQKGIDVKIVTSKFSRSWPRHETLKGVPVCRLPSPRIKGVGALFFLFFLACHLFKNRSRYNIIHAFQIGYTSALAVFAGKMLQKKTVLTLASSGLGGDINRHKRTAWGKLFIVLCCLATRIVILNKTMRDELISISYNDHSSVFIPNGVNLREYSSAPHNTMIRKKMGLNKDKIIIYTGRLAPEKGLYFLIHAYAKLHTGIPTKLLILGDGKELQGLRKIIKHYNAEDRIKLLPAVDEVSDFLQIADIFVMPSQFEGLSNSILEAMACGLPVIATRVEGNIDIIQDGINGILVEPNDEQSLINAITRLLANPDNARALGLKAQMMVQQEYSLDKTVEKYVLLYEKLINTCTAL
jgi:glycosyltransferase involved in cell wall biosynthesis